VPFVTRSFVQARMPSRCCVDGLRQFLEGGQASTARPPEPGEEPLEPGLVPVLAHPDHPAPGEVVHERQVLLALAAAHLDDPHDVQG